MATTDIDALTERIARALHGFEWDCAHDGSDGEWALSDAKSYYLSLSAAVLPIVAAEARKAKAEAWDEGASEGARAVNLIFSMDLSTPPRLRNPYRETGDSDDHR